MNSAQRNLGERTAPAGLRAVLCPLLALMLACLSAFQPALSQQADEEGLERKVKAAFLYKFTGYVEWPQAALPPGDAPLVIAVMGADDIAAELAQIVRGRSMGTHPIAVRRLKEGESLAGVHMLFVGGTDRARAAAVAKAAQQRPLLLVSEAEGALGAPGAQGSGSAINFLIVEGRVRFEVSPGSAERNGVRLSSRLLAVAHKPGS